MCEAEIDSVVFRPISIWFSYMHGNYLGFSAGIAIVLFFYGCSELTSF